MNDSNFTTTQSSLYDRTGQAGAAITRPMVFLFAFICAAIVANIYYAQPLIQLIAPDLGMSAKAASLIMSATQFGFGIGVFFLVPLGDMLENRRLIVSAMCLVTVGLAAAASVHQAWQFLAACLVIGLASVSVQMIVPLAAHLTPEASRGRIVGNIMSGLTLGILLSRPAASLIADHFGWRAVFLAATCFMVVAIVLGCLYIPTRRPKSAIGYGALIGSLVRLVRTSPVLRRRAFYQGTLFFAFATFWSSVPLELSQRHGLSQTQIGLFTLMAAAGVFAGPIAGRMADAGYTRSGTRVAFIVAVASLLFGLTSQGKTILGLGATALLLDFGMQFNMVLGQRAIYALASEERSRLNALYLTSMFVAAGCGSALASNLHSAWGWTAVAIAASLPPIVGGIHALMAYRH